METQQDSKLPAPEASRAVTGSAELVKCHDCRGYGDRAYMAGVGNYWTVKCKTCNGKGKVKGISEKAWLRDVLDAAEENMKTYPDWAQPTPQNDQAQRPPR